LPDPRPLRISRQDPGTVATGFATSDRATPDLAAQAVRAALARIDASLAGSVLLFLTSHFHRNAQAAVSAAARAGRCVQVAGCTAPGVLTETDWSLDAPAAAALAFCGDIGMMPPSADEPILTLTTPAAAREAWLTAPAQRLGILTTNADSENPGRVWLHGKVIADGHCETGFSHSRMAVGVSRGIRALTPIMTVTEADGHEVFALDGEPALETLLRKLPEHRQSTSGLPEPHLFAALTSEAVTAEEAMARGSYRLLPILGASQDEQSLTLALPLSPGDRLFWALRQPMAAVQETDATLSSAAAAIPTPDFALLFACIGRGPYFFGSEDLDLAQIGERFPGLPVIGAYGAGEIAPLPDGNAVISYSAVTALVGHVQP
jgi:small ligand-binding sensory domain FIST